MTASGSSNDGDEAPERERTSPDLPPDELNSIEEEAKRFFDLSLDLFCIADSEGYFLEVNPQFEEVLGYSAEELTSRSFLEFVHPDDREVTQEVLEAINECEEDVEQFVNRYICKDGSIVWLEWRARAHRSGELSYATARDITDLKRIERERREFKKRFEQAQKLESVGLLAGGVAHDFNNLLMTILANVNLVRDELGSDHEALERLETITEASYRGAELCDQLLAYAGEGQFNVEESRLSEIIRDTDHLLETAVSESVELTFDLENDLPVAELDRTQLQQILMNVVQNASEAIGRSEGGVRIETGVTECSRRDLARTYLDDELESGRYVYMTIEDDGEGMTDEEMESLFDPFFTTKEAGRGLGLSATLGIVRAHCGAVEVESTPGEGTCFTFYLPITETKQPFTPAEERRELVARMSERE